MRNGLPWILLVAALITPVGCTLFDDSGGERDEPAAVDVNGRTYVEKFTCSQQFTGAPPACVDVNATDKIQFTSTGGDDYEVLDVPPTGFVYHGTFDGLVFEWTATSPDGYTETGTWTFAADGNSFAGESTYEADDDSYTGECAETGLLEPGVPPDPPTVGACAP